ncbi:MAG: uncharacterized protein QOI03_1495 [Solirubrobacteraceae bacterium]|jgi:ketosteroid isomerase-like protein|nr:uncharacterized protein [Solirubrobacteraceae bacterium]
MSRENVEVVEAMFAGAATSEKEALRAALPEVIRQSCDPDIEWIEHLEHADGRVYRGHEGVLESFERWLEQWDEYGFEAERFIDCGDEVLVVAREHAQGMTSGVRVSSRIYSVLTMRAGKIARYQEFYDEQAALKAVGLAG